MAAIGLSNPFGVAILHIMFQLASNAARYCTSPALAAGAA